jgi:hypothetical protein
MFGENNTGWTLITTWSPGTVEIFFRIMAFELLWPNYGPFQKAFLISNYHDPKTGLTSLLNSDRLHLPPKFSSKSK